MSSIQMNLTKCVQFNIMKKYVETEKGEIFDWNNFLKNAIRRKTPMDEDMIQKVYDLSEDWVTCACGNQCSIIPRYEESDCNYYEGSPKDDLLRELGIQFHSDIDDQNWVEAKNTLRAIERRSDELIQDIIKEQANFAKEMGYKLVKL